MTKINLKAYLSGVKFIDTTEMAQADTSSLAIFKANKSILLIESEKSKSDTISGTYSITGTTMVLNLIDPVDGPYTEEYESLTYDTTYMSFIGYDPNKTDPNRSVYTPTYKRK